MAGIRPGYVRGIVGYSLGDKTKKKEEEEEEDENLNLSMRSCWSISSLFFFFFSFFSHRSPPLSSSSQAISSIFFFSHDLLPLLPPLISSSSSSSSSLGQICFSYGFSFCPFHLICSWVCLVCMFIFILHLSSPPTTCFFSNWSFMN